MDQKGLVRVGRRHSVSKRGLLGRRALRRFIYAQFSVMEGLKIAAGRSEPLVRFTVEDDPPSVYLVFRLLPGAEQEVARLAGLPAGLVPAPIACMEGEEPAHHLTLNIYRVSGITNALRAEWSAYVDTGDGVPRYCVIDARSSTKSMDPVDVITPASHVEHRRVGNRVETVLDDDRGRFESTIDLPSDMASRAADRSSVEWGTANDMIYWANGIADRTFYDAGMAAADQVRLPGSAVQVADATRWASLVNPEPAHVLVFRRPIQFVVSPWVNVETL